MTICGQCGARFEEFHGERVHCPCPRCGWSSEVRPPLDAKRLEALATALSKRRAIVKWRPPLPPMPLEEVERLLRGNMQLAEALDTVRPTVALIEHAHALLQKHGISWRA